MADLEHYKAYTAVTSEGALEIKNFNRRPYVITGYREAGDEDLPRADLGRIFRKTNEKTERLEYANAYGPFSNIEGAVWFCQGWLAAREELWE